MLPSGQRRLQCPQDASKSAEVVKESFVVDEASLNTKVLEFMKSAVAINLVEADIIVSVVEASEALEGFTLLPNWLK